MLIYCNKTVAQYENTVATNLQELVQAAEDSKGIAVDTSIAEDVCRMFGVGTAAFAVVEDIEGFANGDYAFYISTTEKYSQVQSRLPARFSVIAIDTEVIYGSYAECFSVSQNLTEDEKKVALAFVNYLLSDNAQDYLYIQNWTGKMPLNSAALKVVEDVYSELEGLFDNISKYRVNP